MASFTIVRVATPSETPPHSPPHTGTTWNLSVCNTLSLVTQESPSLSPDPLSIPAGTSYRYPQHPQHPELLYYSPVANEQIKVFRVCNSFLGSVALTEKPRIFHSKGLELFSSTWHLHCAGELGPAFEAGVLLLVLRNSGKKSCFIFKQISDSIKERNCCAVHAAQEGENL